MTRPHPTAPKRGDIQGLRAVAVLLVIFAHAGFPGFAGGFIGVDVFFVISGFLITGLLLKEVDRTGRVSITGFYSRRARRILPAATLVLVATMAVVALSESLTRITSTATDARWSAVFLANVRFAREGTDYFADAEPSVFQHYWSLAVEEQFYVVWPLLILLLAARMSRRALAVVLGTITLASLAWSVHLTASDPIAAYFSSFARAHELAIGGLLAIVGDRLRKWPKPLPGVIGVLGLLGLAVATITIDAQTPFPGWQALVPVLATGALIAAGDGEMPGVGRLLALRPLQWLGDMSFSLYLWHWPVLILGERHLDWSTWVRTPALLVITLALSALTHRFVEVPFQHGRLPLSKGRPALALWPIALVTVLLASGLAVGHGERAIAEREQAARDWFDRNPTALVTADGKSTAKDVAKAVRWAERGAPLPPELDIEGLGDDVWNREYKCFATWKKDQHELCPVGDKEAEDVVVLWGDSHAAQWLPALDEVGREEGFRVVPLLKMSCGPYDVPQWLGQMPREVCEDYRAWARAQIDELDPAAVVLGARGLRSTRLVDGREREDLWSEGVRTTVADVATLTPQVKVLADNATRTSSASDCLTQPDADQATCLSPKAGPEVDSNPLTVEAIADTGADFVDIGPLVCTDTTCPLVVGDQVVYFDEDHITVTWARTVATDFGKLLALRL